MPFELANGDHPQSQVINPHNRKTVRDARVSGLRAALRVRGFGVSEANVGQRILVCLETGEVSSGQNSNEHPTKKSTALKQHSNFGEAGVQTGLSCILSRESEVCLQTGPQSSQKTDSIFRRSPAHSQQERVQKMT